MPRQITSDLESLRGKSITDLCPQGFHDSEANHCAHFVSHAGGYQFGFLCHRISGSTRKGVCVRVQELFPECPEVGKWSNLPQTDDDLLVFITARRNVNLAAKTIENVPRKHIGILRGGQVYHYSNTEDKVVKQTPDQVLTRFRGTYDDSTVDLFWGTLPVVARSMPKPPAASRRKAVSRGAGAASRGGALAMTLVRKIFTDNSTIGELSLNGKFECFILEDKVRPEKIAGVTAIPAGTYPVVITRSPRFDRDLPLLENVPNFEGIRIHPGNSAADTEGCLLPGKSKAKDFVGDSRAAFNALFAKLTKAKQAGQAMSIEITEAPASRSAAPRGAKTRGAKTRSAKAAEAHYFRVLADPLAVRSSEDPIREDNVTGSLDYSQIVMSKGEGKLVGWLSVESVDGDEKVSGLVQEEFLEAVSVPPAVTTRGKSRGAKSRKARTRGAEAAPQSVELHRVKVDSANLRTEAGIIKPETVIAALGKGHVVTKVGESKKFLWWEVRTVLNGEELTGFMNSSLLQPADGSPAALKEDVATPTADVEVSEKALQMILDFEGMDQPSKWPGGQSGISLGHGYDLGFQSPDQFRSDWSPHLTEEQVKRLTKALGKTGNAAKNMASQYTDIKITVAAADEVFARVTLPKIKGWGASSFPGITKLHPDAQGALVSLVYNRGTAMNGDRRREMREVRDAVASTTMSREDKLRSIADSIRSMKRLWPDTLGLRRRRDAEAKMVEDTI